MSLLVPRSGVLLALLVALAGCDGTTERDEEPAGTGAAGAAGGTSSGGSGPGNASSGSDTGSGGAATSSSSTSAGGAEASPCNGEPCGATCITEAGEGVCDAEGNCSIDAPVVCGCDSELCQVLDDGVWLIGWAGGLNHYSWLRFQYLGATSGTVDLLALVCTGCTSYYDCDGQGAFTLDPANGQMIIDLPAACVRETQAMLVFGAFYDVEWPMGALTAVELTDGMYPIEGYLFPPEQCDPGFTTCGDPFQ